MIYFISGHRDLTEREFQIHYIPIIEQVMGNDRDAEFVLGTSEGCDTFALKYLDEIEAWFKVYPWEKEFYRPVKGTGYISDIRFETWEERDKYLTNLSHKDIAWIRKGKESSATAMNILRRFR